MSEEKDKFALQDAWLEEVAKKHNADKKEILVEIERLEAEANLLLNKATDLCDAYGISHYFSISPLSQTYQGTGVGEKINLLVSEAEKTNLFDEDDDVESIISEFFEMGGEYDGWQHSAVC